MKNSLLTFDNFTPESSKNWIIETDNPPEKTNVSFFEGYVDVQAKGGVTLWYKTSFSGNYRIEYDVEFVLGGESHERLSDMNCFWNASDPSYPDDFFANSHARGSFETYDSLHLYYVGYGGNYNTTTRFRKYLGTAKNIIKEYTDPSHLLKADTIYHVAIEIENGFVRYYVNNECLVNYWDCDVYPGGYFGFRTVLSHVRISRFRAYTM